MMYTSYQHYFEVCRLALLMPNRPCSRTDRVVDLSDVEHEFIASVDQLRDTIVKHLSMHHAFAGEKIAGGKHTHEIVDGLCVAVNSAEDVSPPRYIFVHAAPHRQKTGTRQSYNT